MSLSNSNQEKEAQKTFGGLYRQVRDANIGGQVHHIPADSISPLNKDDGPGIWMKTPDHQRTGSWGRGLDQQAYREQQKHLIDTNGWDGFKAAMQMDIADLNANFDDKYAQGTEQALAYFSEHETELKKKFEDSVNAKENALSLKSETLESASGNQASEIFPFKNPEKISAEVRDRLNKQYASEENSQSQSELSKEEELFES